MTIVHSIQEFEAITKISAHNLRYFDKINLLKPYRASNGYRVYTSEQVAVAEMILILQKAKVPNAEIKILLENHASATTINRLKQSQQALHDYILELTEAHKVLSAHIVQLENINNIKLLLDKPFVEIRDDIVVGALSLQTENILNFFESIGSVSKNNSWYLFYNYGFLLNVDDVTETEYPLETIYCDIPKMINESPSLLSKGRYISNYCSGSLERNKKVYELIQYVKSSGYRVNGPIMIENVSGPAIEINKQDFIIKIMIPIEE